MADDLSGEERHQKALAASLGMPDHPDAAAAEVFGPKAISGLRIAHLIRVVLVMLREAGIQHAGVCIDPARRQGTFNRFVHRMELMIGRRLFGDYCSVIVEHDKIQYKVEKPPLFKNPLEQHFELHGTSWGDFLAIDGAPWHEPVPAGGESPAPGLQAVGNHKQLVVDEETGDIAFVCLKLVEGVADGGLLISRVLELDHAQGQAIDKNYYVRPPVSAVLDDRELIDGKPVVVFQVLKIEQPDLVVNLAAVLHVGDINAIGKHPMETPVVLDQAG